MQPPVSGSSWLGVTDRPLPVGAAHDWTVLADCGAVVAFTGTVRDHAVDGDGRVRSDVSELVYEAYEEHAVPAMAAVDTELRRRWPAVRRTVILHRVGALALRDAAVIVVVSAPHRSEAFDAARFAIDAVKASVPIWKRETWADGSDWGTGAARLVSPSQVPGVAS